MAENISNIPKQDTSRACIICRASNQQQTLHEPQLFGTVQTRFVEREISWKLVSSFFTRVAFCLHWNNTCIMYISAIKCMFRSRLNILSVNIQLPQQRSPPLFSNLGDTGCVCYISYGLRNSWSICHIEKIVFLVVWLWFNWIDLAYTNRMSYTACQTSFLLNFYDCLNSFFWLQDEISSS